jgi:sorting nexin-41/42
MSADNADLGAALNGFSLNEQGPLASAIEKTGQAIDATYLSTTVMVSSEPLSSPPFNSFPRQLQELESHWAEPLHEYSQFAQIIRKMLLYRHQKHLQYEMIQTQIEAKRAQLAELERVEAEAMRLASALSNGGRERVPVGINPPSPVGQQANGENQDAADERDSAMNNSQTETVSSEQELGEHSPVQDDTDLPSYNTPISKRRTPGLGLLNALSYTIHGMMDVDPETARRNNITKTRESIAQV